VVDMGGEVGGWVACSTDKGGMVSGRPRPRAKILNREDTCNIYTVQRLSITPVRGCCAG